MFHIIRVLSIAPCGEQGLSREIPVVVILIGMVRICRELIAGVHHRPTGCSIADRIIGEVLRRAQ